MRVVEDEEADRKQKRKNKLTILGILLALILIAVFTYVRNNQYYQNSVIATLRAQQESTGYIIISGPENTRKTNTMVELLKAYGFKTVVEGTDALTPPTVTLSDTVHVDMETLIPILKRMKVQNFHDGYDANSIVVYGITEDKNAQNARETLDKKGIQYEYIDINSDNPSVLGIDARLILSGYDPEIIDDSALALEYKGKMYSGPDALKVINKMQ